MKGGLPKEPTIKGMLFTALSGTVLGLLFGAVILLKETPTKSRSAGAGVENLGIYTAEYSVGSVASAESATMRSRLSRLSRKTPGPIPFSESELNQYLSQFQSTDTNADGTPVDISFSLPNIRLEEKAFVLNSKVVVNPKSDRFEIMVQAFCHFETGPDGIEMKMDRIILNSFVVPEFGGFVGDMFLSKLSAISWPADVVDSWNAIREIELLEKSLVLVL